MTRTSDPHAQGRHFAVLEEAVTPSGRSDIDLKSGGNGELPLEMRFWWKLVHAVSFLIGGTTFIFGTLCFFPEDFNWEFGFELSAILYVIGSCGFLTVDVLEFFTFTDDFWLRLNIFASAFGSFLYVVGSAGFEPHIMAETTAIGVWGFIGGSFFIGCSQACKVYRIGKTPEGKFSFSRFFSDRDIFTACGVEANAGIGAWCFFVGTIMFNTEPDVPSDFYTTLLVIWVFGSVFFTLGGCFLAYRHFVMGI